MKLSIGRLVWIALSILVCGPGSQEAKSQVRGVYPLGMSATNSGVTPAPGFTYANQLLIYSRNEFRGPHGEVLATGLQSVVMDLNSIVWVSKKEVLGGGRFSMSATLPFANNSLSSDVTGPIGGGGGCTGCRVKYYGAETEAKCRIQVLQRVFE